MKENDMPEIQIPTLGERVSRNNDAGLGPLQIETESVHTRSRIVKGLSEAAGVSPNTDKDLRFDDSRAISSDAIAWHQGNVW